MEFSCEQIGLSVATNYLEPIIGNLLEDFRLQETTRWGEHKGESMSFTEYLSSK